MNIFVIHKGNDFDKCKKLIKKLHKQNISINLLLLQNGGDNWFNEAKKKIRESDCVLVYIGKHTHESENVDKEIRYAIKQKSRFWFTGPIPSISLTKAYISMINICM